MYLCELLGIGQIVNSDGQEDVEQCICGGVKETLTDSDGLWGGSNEEMEGGNEDMGKHMHLCIFHQAKTYFTRVHGSSNFAGYSCQKVWGQWRRLRRSSLCHSLLLGTQCHYTSPCSSLLLSESKEQHKKVTFKIRRTQVTPSYIHFIFNIVTNVFGVRSCTITTSLNTQLIIN